MGIFDQIDRFADQLGDLIVPDDVRAHVELGAAYLERGDLEQAAHELDLALKAKPDHARAHYLLGLVEARRGRDDEAFEHLSEAARTKPEVAETHLLLGELHRRRGDFGEAAAAFRAALGAGLSDAAPRHVAYRGLGAIYLAEHQTDKAVRELRKAVASSPDEPEAQALLGRALFLRGDQRTARVCLERATRAGSVEPSALVTLGELCLEAGDEAEAERSFERALTHAETEVAARLGLSRLLLARGDLTAAHGQVMRALERAPERPDLLVTLGRIAAATHSSEVALGAFDRALVTTAAQGARTREFLLFDRRPVLEEALQIALRAGLMKQAIHYAASLLADLPEHPQALAATAGRALEEGDLVRASALVERSLHSKETLEGRLVAARVAERQGELPSAAASLRRAALLAPNDARPRERLAALYQADEATPRELYPLLSLVHRRFAHTSEWAELSLEAGRLLETLDRPLLMTVMGEFNAGKSTFVNALLGEEVAPMGVTPTTATINILKYGVERKGRVVYLDETVRELPWSEVPRLLRGLRAEEARRIRLVELLYPLETLERVNVVDTPGLNSIIPEHEETARRFMSESDAILWLFSVDQAGKATEGEALSRITAEGKKLLGVLNKIDRCPPDEVQQIVNHVMGSLGHAIELVVPVSAKEALLGRQSSDEARLQHSNYSVLRQALEERFFSRARTIQRQAVRSRVTQLLGRARKIVIDQIDRLQPEPIEKAHAEVRSAGARLISEFLPAERRRLFHAAADVHEASAREILDFVRPRRWVFGSHSASPADRDFLVNLLDERFGALLEESRGRVVEQAKVMVTILHGVEPPIELGSALGLLDEQVYNRYRAFARGYLRGGRVDDFFTRSLPKIDLNEQEIRRALVRGTPWSEDIVEAELHQPLRRWAESFSRDLAGLLEQRGQALDLERFDLEVRLVAPLDRWSAALEEMVP